MIEIGKGKAWNKEEELYLEESWGYVSIPTIAKKLNRSPNAIKTRAQKLKLGPVLLSGDYITLNQLIIAVTGNKAESSYHLISWVKKRALPVHTKKVNKCTFRVVYLNEFWNWAEKNRSFIDFSKMEPLSLGEEPKWVVEQRKKDYQSFQLQRKDVWTTFEDSKLLDLLKKQQYGYTELSEMLNRSAGAIQRRCTDLGTPYRPVKADTHGIESKWTYKHYEILADCIKNGDSYSKISKLIGKSEKAIRGKVYTVYLTENSDKIRAMMKQNSWGFGAPEPTVKQAIHLSNKSATVKKDLSVLAGILKYRINKLGYDPYWQRFMCSNWDDFDGCSLNCKNCDSCNGFVRIKPQYCKRCGETFYQRKESIICLKCEEIRRRQNAKKWAILSQKNQCRGAQI